MNTKIAALLGVSAFLLMSCSSQPAATAPATRSFAPVEVPPDSNNGLMFIGAQAFEMYSGDHLGRNRTILTGIALKNIETGKGYNAYLDGDFAVGVLPAGTYCVASFRTFTNVNLAYCQDPYFIVSPGEAVNLGYVLLGVNYRGPGGIRYKTFYSYNSKMQLAENLTPAAREYVGKFLGNAKPALTALAGSTWYGYEFGSLSYVMKFRKDGMLEYKQQPESLSRKPRMGTWTVDATGVDIRLDADHLVLRGELRDGVLSGIVQDTSVESSGDPNKGARWIWQATPNPAVAIPFNASPKAKAIYLDGIYYPQEALLKGIKGSVRLHYQLPLPNEGLFGMQLTVNPEDIQVISSTPAGVFDDVALEAFKSAFFADAIVDGKEVVSQGEETITFDIVDGKPVISYSSKLEPIAAPGGR